MLLLLYVKSKTNINSYHEKVISKKDCYRKS